MNVEQDRSQRASAIPYASPLLGAPPVWRVLHAPVGVGSILLSLIAMASLLWANRLPLAHVGYGLLGMLLFLGVLAMWLPRCIVQIVVAARDRAPGYAATRWKGWIVPPLLAALTFAAVQLNWPMRCALKLSRPAMDRFAGRYVAGGPNTPAPAQQRLGLYTAVRIDPIPGGVRFLAEGSGFFRAAGGFAYSPNGPPPQEDPFDVYTPIGDGWYVREWIKP